MDLKISKVHEDERRSINVIPNLLSEGREFSIINLKKGKAIGGCFHKEKEFFTIVKGKVLTIVGDTELIAYPGISRMIPANMPHLFQAIGEDAIVIEWGIKTEDKITDKKDPKLKELVDKINNE